MAKSFILFECAGPRQEGISVRFSVKFEYFQIFTIENLGIQMFLQWKMAHKDKSSELL